MSNDTIIKSIIILSQIYNLLLFARIISSWFPINRSNQLYRLLYMVTEPVLGPIRDMFHKFGLMRGGVDFSPIVAFFILNFIRNLIIRMLL